MLSLWTSVTLVFSKSLIFVGWEIYRKHHSPSGPSAIESTKSEHLPLSQRSASSPHFGGRPWFSPRRKTRIATHSTSRVTGIDLTCRKTKHLPKKIEKWWKSHHQGWDTFLSSWGLQSCHIKYWLVNICLQFWMPTSLSMDQHTARAAAKNWASAPRRLAHSYAGNRWIHEIHERFWDILINIIPFFKG